MRASALTTAVILTMLLVAGGAAAEGPTRAEYVAQVESICERNTLANDRILSNVRDKIRQDRLGAAGGQFIRASEAFGGSIREIAAVPRPPADDARLVKWIGFLKILKGHLRKLGKALQEHDRIKAVHEQVRVERGANATNNVGYVFEFRNCRITPSRFT